MKLAWLLAVMPLTSVGAEFAMLEDETSSGSWRVQLQARPLSQSKAHEWGARGWSQKTPALCISELNLQNKGLPVPVAKRFYADLCDVNRIWIIEEKSNVTLVLDGGDASSGYRVELKIENRRLISRTIKSFGLVVERTILNYPVIR